MSSVRSLNLKERSSAVSEILKRDLPPGYTTRASYLRGFFGERYAASIVKPDGTRAMDIFVHGFGRGKPGIVLHSKDAHPLAETIAKDVKSAGGYLFPVRIAQP